MSECRDRLVFLTADDARRAITAYRIQTKKPVWAVPHLCHACGSYHVGRSQDAIQALAPEPLPAGPLAYKATRLLSLQHNIPHTGIVAYFTHHRSARRQSIDFLFTLPDWWAWWQIDGRWAQRGRGANQLCMARRGDTGPYSPENVYCATAVQNTQDVARPRRSEARDPGARKRGGEHHRSKPVITPEGRFASAALAAEAYGIHPGTARNKAGARQTGWHYED